MLEAISSGSSILIPNLKEILLFLYVSKMHMTTVPSALVFSIFFSWILGSLSFFAPFASGLSFFSPAVDVPVTRPEMLALVVIDATLVLDKDIPSLGTEVSEERDEPTEA